MKKIILGLLILIAVASVGSAVAQKYANSRKLFREVMGAGASMVNVMETNDLEVVKIDIDLVGVDNSKQALKTFSSNFQYLISAVGQPSRIADLDLELFYLSTEGQVIKIAEDTEADNAPTIRFQPEISGTYLIKIKAAQMLPGNELTSGFYFLVIAHD